MSQCVHVFSRCCISMSSRVACLSLCFIDPTNNPCTLGVFFPDFAIRLQYYSFGPYPLVYGECTASWDRCFMCNI